MTIKETFDRLYEITPEGTVLNNMTERKDLFYLDNKPADDEKTDELLEKIATYLSEEASKFEFNEDDDPYSHYSVYCSQDIDKSLGVTGIVVCPYSKNPYPLVDSNYIWTRHAVYASFFIDIYGVAGANRNDYIRSKVLLELRNFARDAKWVIDGVYDEEMAKMEKKVDNLEF